MIVLVLGEMVKCMVHLLKEGQPVKLDSCLIHERY
jgi:hypothetical protein